MLRSTVGGVAFLTLKVPMTGEEESGDGYVVLPDESGALIVVLDGLGHGPAAAAVITRAIPVIEQSVHLPLASVFKALDACLVGSRGAVAVAAKVAPDQQTVTWAAVGDVQAVIVAPGIRTSLVGKPGILGYRSPQITTAVRRFDGSSVLCLATDGVAPEFARQVSSTLGLEENARRLEPLLRPNKDDSLFLLARLGSE